MSEEHNRPVEECGGCISEERDALRVELAETKKQLAEASFKLRSAEREYLEQGQEIASLTAANLALESLVERMRVALKHYSGGSLRPWDTKIADQILSSLQPDLQLLPKLDLVRRALEFARDEIEYAGNKMIFDALDVLKELKPQHQIMLQDPDSIESVECEDEIGVRYAPKHQMSDPAI